MEYEDTDTGIRRADLYHIGFYEKLPFFGSYRGMHYRIAGIFDENIRTRLLCVTIWPGPYNFESTDEGLKVSELFDFGEEGLIAVAEYLNQYYREHFG